MSRAFGPRVRRGYTAIGLALALFGSAQAAILDNSIALDAVYIPALSLTNAKPGDTAAALIGALPLHLDEVVGIDRLAVETMRQGSGKAALQAEKAWNAELIA